LARQRRSAGFNLAQTPVDTMLLQRSNEDAGVQAVNDMGNPVISPNARLAEATVQQ